eukprot:11388127-Alexandrium_andersonii.AAC.1
MSASLVGSEMCIRDRSRGMGAGRAASLAPPAPLREAFGTAIGEQLPDAVSYTHLTLPTICSV